MNLTKMQKTAYTCPIAAIVASRVDSLKQEGVRNATLNIVGGFFVPFFHQLVGWVREALSLLGSFLTSLSTRIQLAFFSFDSEIGEYSKRRLNMSALPAIIPHETLHQTVNARDLHAFLEIKKYFSDWIKVQIKRAGLIENEDFVVNHLKGENPTGGRPATEYHLTLESGKHIAMMSQSEKGQEVRHYFITCEKIAKQPATVAELSYEEVMEKALTMSKAKIHALKQEKENLETQVVQLVPKAKGLDRIASTTGNLCITDAAKVLQIKPKELFSWMSAEKWIYKRQGTSWLGFQCRIDQGLLQHKVVTVYSGGEARIREQVLLTSKGLAKLAAVFSTQEVVL